MSAAERRIADAVGRVLDRIVDPCSLATGTPLGLVEMGLIESVDTSANGDVRVRIRLTSPLCINVGYLKTEVEDGVREIPGVRRVSVSADDGGAWSPELMSLDVRRRRAEIFRQRILDRC